MIKLDSILEKLDASDRTEVGEYFFILYDSTSTDLLKLLVTSYNSISTNDLPLPGFGSLSSSRIISRFMMFEKLTLVESKNIQIETITYKTYSITDHGRLFLEKYVKKHSSQNQVDSNATPKLKKVTRFLKALSRKK